MGAIDEGITIRYAIGELVTMYAKCGMLKKAQELFDKCTSRESHEQA
jgi:hypothetical protein